MCVLYIKFEYFVVFDDRTAGEKAQKLKCQCIGSYTFNRPIKCYISFLVLVYGLTLF